MLETFTVGASTGLMPIGITGSELAAFNSVGQMNYGDGTGIGIAVVDGGVGHTPILQCNHDLTLITGYTAWEIMGRSIGFMKTDHRDSARITALQHAIRQRTSCKTVVRCFRKNGTPLSSEIIVSPFGGMCGMSSNVALLFRDITDQQPAPRTATTGIYGDANANAPIPRQDVNVEAIGGIAHDFRNLHTAIICNLWLIGRELAPDSDAIQALERINKAAKQAQQLCNRLLKRTPAAPLADIQSTASLIREMADISITDIRLRCDFELQHGLWPLAGDTDQIGRVLQNLIINAGQAMDNAGTIEISAENIVVRTPRPAPLESGSYVKISVTDHGAGIEPELLPRLFEPHVTTRPEGSGLGLAICQKIVREHHGTISFETDTGIGSTFSVYFPTANDQIAEPLA